MLRSLLCKFPIGARDLGRSQRGALKRPPRAPTKHFRMHICKCLLAGACTQMHPKKPRNSENHRGHQRAPKSFRDPQRVSESHRKHPRASESLRELQRAPQSLREPQSHREPQKAAECINEHQRAPESIRKLQRTSEASESNSVQQYSTLFNSSPQYSRIFHRIQEYST